MIFEADKRDVDPKEAEKAKRQADKDSRAVGVVPATDPGWVSADGRAAIV